MTKFRRAAAALLFLLLPGAAGASDPEQQLLRALDHWRSGSTARALAVIEQTLRAQPNFRLAHLLHAELLAARSGRPRPHPPASPELPALLAEAELRLRQAHAVPWEDSLPDAILRLPPYTRHALLVDLARARLYVLEHRRGELRVVAHYYAGIGKEGAHKRAEGDNRTPVGVYDITWWIDGATLPDLYGAGAFPLDYPNPWDRRHRRTGSGIWVHGVPTDTYARVPLSSEGCVTVANRDLEALRKRLGSARTPVILSDSVQWIAPEDLRSVRDEFDGVLERWRASWAARDTRGYLALYAEDLWTEGMGKAAFAAYQERLQASRRSVRIRLRDVELFRYPAPEPLWLARFTQDYRGDGYARTSRKQQYWRRDADGWRIIMEETL